MKKASKWLRWCLFAFLFMLWTAWVLVKVSQWTLRRQAEELLSDVQSIKVDHSTSADVQSLNQKWGQWGIVYSSCTGDTCHSDVRINRMLPLILNGSPEGGVRNFVPMVISLLGLRNEYVGGRFTLEHGVVKNKWFAEDIGLPVWDWYVRGNAYVPDLLVSSGEVFEFNESQLEHVRLSHPYRIARFIKGTYGVNVSFTSEEKAAEQAALMNFQFSCITQFLPCRSESQILPAGWQLIQEDQ